MRKTGEKAHSVTLHHCRLHLGAAQSRWLATLLAQPGILVEDRDLLPERLSPQQITAIREVIAPHGLAIYRVKRYGFILLSEQGVS